MHPVPEAIDREVARLKLASLGVEIDDLTAEQRDYLTSWQRSSATGHPTLVQRAVDG